MKEILERLEQADELLSQELDHFQIRPRKIREARDLIQQALDELEVVVRSNQQIEVRELVPSDMEQLE